MSWLKRGSHGNPPGGGRPRQAPAPLDFGSIPLLVGAVLLGSFILPGIVPLLGGSALIPARSSPSTNLPAGSCPRGTERLTLTGSQAQYRNREIPAGTVFDAAGASWVGVHDYPVRLAGGDGVCWSGGLIAGTYPDSDSWESMHDTAAFSVESPGYDISGLRVHNYGDGINMTDAASDFAIRGVHLSYIRDDCIQNDRLHSGLVEDALLDGCYTAFSARDYEVDSTADGRGNDLVIQGSLIRLQPMPTVYKGEAPGHGAFFKWDRSGKGPSLSLYNNIFRVDQHPNGGDLGVPEGYLVSCSNNVVVWLGDGPFPDALPSCFTVTNDVEVWNAAVTAWLSRHSTS